VGGGSEIEWGAWGVEGRGECIVPFSIRRVGVQLEVAIDRPVT